jgi:hypothetical protein
VKERRRRGGRREQEAARKCERGGEARRGAARGKGIGGKRHPLLQVSLGPGSVCRIAMRTPPMYCTHMHRQSLVLPRGLRGALPLLQTAPRPTRLPASTRRVKLLTLTDTTHRIPSTAHTTAHTTPYTIAKEATSKHARRTAHTCVLGAGLGHEAVPRRVLWLWFHPLPRHCQQAI